MAQSATLRFTRVRLRNWRNFREAEVRLSERAFLVGPNASGKSNFLDALRFLRDIAAPTGGLARALAVRDGFRAVRCLHARRPSDIELDIDVGDSEEPTLWRYTLKLNRRRQEPDATVLLETVHHRGDPVAEHRRPDDGGDRLIYSQTQLEQASQNGPFRELVKFLQSTRYLHVVPQIVRDARRHLSAADDPHGGDLLRRIKETPEKTRKPRLKRISEALSIAVPQFTSLDLVDDTDGRPHLEADFDHWRIHKTKQTEEQFSDGTLRFIGFLWSISERGGPLLLEEPELSLSEGVVQHLPAMMVRAQRLSRRQVIATTHSYAMLNAPDVALADVHAIEVGDNGSAMRTLADDEETAARVWAGTPLAEAILPLTTPTTANRLPSLDLLAR